MPRAAYSLFVIPNRAESPVRNLLFADPASDFPRKRQLGMKAPNPTDYLPLLVLVGKPLFAYTQSAEEAFLLRFFFSALTTESLGTLKRAFMPSLRFLVLPARRCTQAFSYGNAHSLPFRNSVSNETQRAK
jgi:hypothetical protein